MGASILFDLLLRRYRMAKLLISGDINKSIWDFYTEEIEVQNLTGILQDGRYVNFPGAINIKSVRTVPHSDKVRLVVYPSNCICGEKSFIGPASITFDLVNFCFVGTEFDIIKEDGRERGIRSLMSLTLGNRNIILKQIPDYEQVEATLKTQRNVEVTCTATTPTSNYNELDDLISTLEYLCDVMSVARATLVNWVSFEVVTSDGMPIYAHYRNSVTGRYSGFALIDRNDPQQTKNFLEKGYLKCNELELEFRVLAKKTGP